MGLGRGMEGRKIVVKRPVFGTTRRPPSIHPSIHTEKQQRVDLFCSICLVRLLLFFCTPTTHHHHWPRSSLAKISWASAHGPAGQHTRTCSHNRSIDQSIGVSLHRSATARRSLGWSSAFATRRSGGCTTDTHAAHASCMMWMETVTESRFRVAHADPLHSNKIIVAAPK